MNISTRLRTIANMVDKCNTVADIGTDHAYLPIYLIKNGICEEAIASDINKGPVERAVDNVKREGLDSKICCKLGAGFSTLKPFEVDCAIIAGMGGNLIRDIIEDEKEVFKSLNYAILQPVQNPEVLRRYLYESGYDILNEELCIDEGKYYEIIKVKYNEKPRELEDIYYEVGERLVEKKHPLLKTYIEHKLDKYNNIIKYISEDTELAEKRKQDISDKIKRLEGLLTWL
jgi:tRNA (adenine22-N1)-methyltransferase